MTGASESVNQQPRERSQSRVRFNLDANEAHSPEATRKRSNRDYFEKENLSDSETAKPEHRHRHRHRRHRTHGQDGNESHDGRRHSEATHSNRNDEDENDSDGTVEMPARFDRHGNKIAETPDSLQTLLGSLASKFLGGEEGGQGEERRGSGGGDGRSGRRRHRH